MKVNFSKNLQHAKDKCLLGRFQHDTGFSLLEVIIALSLIMLLSMGITSLMRGSLAVREGIAKNNTDTNAASSALDLLAKDLAHAFIVSRKDLFRSADSQSRRSNTIFRIEKSTGGDKVSFTSMSNTSLVENSHQSERAYIVYAVRENTKTGLLELQRGVDPRISAEFKEDPPMRTVLTNVKSFEVTPWRGDDWIKDRWDSSQGEWADQLPAMVKVRVVIGEKDQASSTADEVYQTVVYLYSALGFVEPRQGASTVRWDKL